MTSYLDSLNAAKVLRVVFRLFAGALVTLLLLAGVYFWQFHGPLSTCQGVWGEFGDFLGGTLNPLIGLFALFALFMTIVLQTKELESTREELRRAAASQEKSEVALTKQSRAMELSTRLAALNALLTYVDSWVARANEGKISTNEYPDYKYWVEERRPVLIRQLDLLYNQMYGTDEA